LRKTDIGICMHLHCTSDVVDDTNY